MEREKIVRLEKNILWSRIDQRQISTLPKGLRELCERFLNRANSVKQIIIDDNLQSSLVEFPDRYDMISSLSPEAKTNLEDLIFLYRWYTKEHWSMCGSDKPRCAECQCEQDESRTDIFCKNPQCSSHDIWWQIVGPAYQFPDENTSCRM